MLQHTSNTKVSDLYRSILIHENVLSLQVSVQNFSVVDMLDSESHLHKPVEDLVFTVADFSNFLLVCDLGVEISTICIVHDDAKTALVHK